MTPRILSLRKEIARIHEVARRRHRGGENARRVVQGISDSIDGLLRSFFADDLLSAGRHMALVAVGGYGRRELCPFSDVDLMFLCDDLEKSGGIVERMVRDLWDSGFDLGHSVRSPEECLTFMRDDHVTAATLLESRFLAGSEVLMRRFQEKSVARYRKHHLESFATQKAAALARSLNDPGRTIYVTEPHIKDGAGCLRDIQHILWIERARRNVIDFIDVASHGGFSYEEMRKLEEAYTFYLGARCELHFATGLRQDILEHDSQLEVARSLGYLVDDDSLRAVERLMGDYYRHARNVLHFARFYLESKSRGYRFFTKLRRRFLAARLEPEIVDGHIYMPDDPELDPDQLGVRILRIFSLAQEADAEPSQTVCEWIRRRVNELPESFSRWARTNKAFLRILKAGKNTGRVLTWMHDVGILARIVPEFEKLTCLVTFDGHHQFTVDEHTLRALRELDRLETDADHPEATFREVLARIPDRRSLRTALLLHDLGKALSMAESAGSAGQRTPGHESTGAEAARVICERLGLDDSAIEEVEFLVYRHLAMFRYSERMDFTEDATLASFAKLVGTVERLDRLYLFTYLDIRSVGPGVWTAWKGAQLAELYQKTRIQLETGGPPDRDTAENLAVAGVDEAERVKVLEHCRLIDHLAYERETVPERMLAHMRMIDAFKAGGSQIEHQQLPGFSQITFCNRDRAHLFADLTGLLLSEGLNILGARIYSRLDGVVLDLFQVTPSDDLRVEMSRRVDNLRKKLARLETEKIPVSEYLAQRRRFQVRGAKRPLLPPTVRVYNDLSATYTAVEIHAGDRPGLLYDLTVALAELGLDVKTAKVSTMIDRARDVFFVLDGSGRRITSAQDVLRIEHALGEAAQWPGREGGRRLSSTLLSSQEGKE